MCRALASGTLFASMVVSALATCDLNGNWTSSTSGPKPIHIEIFHNLSSGDIEVRSDLWGNIPGIGSVDDHMVSVLPVGKSHKRTCSVNASMYPKYGTATAAPDCTYIGGDLDWCRFPYCPMAKPDWARKPAPEIPIKLSCAWGGDAGPCPLPTWAPQYQLNLSTVQQPCNASGYFEYGHEFGLVSFDWSNAKDLWSLKPNNETDCQEMLVKQARLVKQKNPATKVFVYRNLELALEWLSNQRQAMYDPAKKNLFLQYQSGERKGDVYMEQTFHGLKQYFWDFRNPDTVQFWIDEVTSPAALGSEYVDGVYTDDVAGAFVGHTKAVGIMGYEASDVHDIINANNYAYERVLATLRRNGGYNWQAFGQGDGVSSGVSQNTCASDMRALCAEGATKAPMLMSGGGHGIADQVIAAFLIARGDYWWLGSGWEGCHDENLHPHNPTLNMDVGKPMGECAETELGIFQRQYSKGVAQLDCNSWRATFTFQEPMLSVV